MPVTSAFIWYPYGASGPAYDLRKVVSWSLPDPNPVPTRVNVHFMGEDESVVLTVQFDQAAFEAAMQTAMDAGGGAPTGVASGDLSGSYPGPIVVGIRGVPIPAAPTANGSVATYVAATNNIQFLSPVLYYASGALAAAAAPFVLGQTVVIYPGSPTSEAGTYQVTSGTGASFPANYTKRSDVTDTASEVGIVDAGNYFTSTNVEGALQEAGAKIDGTFSGTAAVSAVTVMDTATIASVGKIVWDVELIFGNIRYGTMVTALHDGTTPYNVSTNVVLTPGTIDVAISVDISAGSLRLLATNASGANAWTYRVRRLSVLAP